VTATGRIVVALVALALVVRLGFVVATPGYVPEHDDLRYDRLACALVVGPAYPMRGPSIGPDSCGAFPRTGPGEPSAFRPPGWPLLLAGVYWASDPLTDDRREVARVVNALLGTLAALLTGLLGFRLGGRRAGLVALGLAAVYVPLVVVGGSLVSEPLGVCLILGAVLAALHAPAAARPYAWIALAGALTGAAALTRPNVLVLLLPLALAVAGRPLRPRAALARALVLGLAAVLVVAPWTARNLRTTGELIPISSHLGEWLAGTYNDVARQHRKWPASWRVPSHVPAFRDLDGRRDLTETERQRELLDRALAYAADHPGYVVVAAAHNARRMLGLDPSWWRANGRSLSLAPDTAVVATIVFLLVALVAIGGAFTARARAVPLWVWAVPALLFAVTIPSGSELRYRAPLEPFVIVLAALALVAVWERRSGRAA